MVPRIEKKDDQSAAFSWWWDSHNRPNQSHWLQSTLSGFDEKTKQILGIIEEDGDSFAQRAEMFYKSRPELISLLQDLHKSYRSLAENYDKLRSEFNPSVNPLIRSLSAMSLDSLSQFQTNNYPKNNNQTSTPSPSHLHLKLIKESADVKRSDQRDQDHDKQSDDDDNDDNNGNIDNELQVVVVKNSNNYDLLEEGPKSWIKIGNETKDLLEELVKQQAELIKRNEEKREAIRDLHSQINRLKDENRLLKTCLPTIHDQVDTTSAAKRNNHRSPISKLKGPFFSKFTGCTGSK